MSESRERNLLSLIDFCMEIYQEKIPDRGEDGFFYAAGEKNAVFGVFDGCGGSGARHYEKLQNRTGAYMASRVIAGATKDWFFSPEAFRTGAADAEALKEVMQQYLEICKAQGESVSMIKGSMSKAFPTTAAIITCSERKGRITASCIWAGDSRCYMLDPDGLRQLSEDDVHGLDAMENLTADGGITNVICASRKILLHEKTLDIAGPCILFTATDGCFGYLTTPMEFEYLLLDTLAAAKSARDWEERIHSFLKEVSGDDFSLCGAPLGFGSFEAIQAAYAGRKGDLYRDYIRGISKKTEEEKLALWRQYAPQYNRYLHGAEIHVPEGGAGRTEPTREKRTEGPKPASRGDAAASEADGSKTGLKITGRALPQEAEASFSAGATAELKMKNTDPGEKKAKGFKKLDELD